MALFTPHPPQPSPQPLSCQEVGEPGHTLRIQTPDCIHLPLGSEPSSFHLPMITSIIYRVVDPVWVLET